MDTNRQRHWVDTSKWALKPTKGERFHVGSSIYMCHRTFLQWARISYIKRMGA